MHRVNRTDHPQGAALDAAGNLFFPATVSGGVIVHSNAYRKQPAERVMPSTRLTPKWSQARRKRGSGRPMFRHFRVVNRPGAGLITRLPEEPYVKGTCTVP